jgi:hypothetical protein
MMHTVGDRFASKLASVDEAPEPLRNALAAALNPDDIPRLLVFAPANRIINKQSPATLLAVLDSGWVVVSGTEETQPSAAHCNFANTLLVELTSILLYGRLRIDFGLNGRAQSTTAQFNTVTEGLYQEATQIILNRMDRVSAIVPCDSNELYPALGSLPLNFGNALMKFLPMGQRVLDVVHWPSVVGRRSRWRRQELAPAAALALTDRELLLVSEEKSWSWLLPGRTGKYGNIATHIPLSRIERLQLSEHEQMNTIDIESRTPQGGEKLKINFPGVQTTEVAAFLERAKLQRMHKASQDAFWVQI